MELEEVKIALEQINEEYSPYFSQQEIHLALLEFCKERMKLEMQDSMMKYLGFYSPAKLMLALNHLRRNDDTEKKEDSSGGGGVVRDGGGKPRGRPRASAVQPKFPLEP